MEPAIPGGHREKLEVLSLRALLARHSSCAHSRDDINQIARRAAVLFRVQGPSKRALRTLSRRARALPQNGRPGLPNTVGGSPYVEGARRKVAKCAPQLAFRRGHTLAQASSFRRAEHFASTQNHARGSNLFASSCLLDSPEQLTLNGHDQQKD